MPDERPIPTEEYWKLRALTAEAGIEVLKRERIVELRSNFGAMGRLLGSLDHAASILEQEHAETIAIKNKMLADSSAQVLAACGIDGKAEEYEIDLAGGEAGAVIRRKG